MTTTAKAPSPLPRPRLARTVGEVTPEWLGAFLSLRHPGTVVERIAIGDRSDGTAVRLSLTIDYAPGRDNGLPARMFLKSTLVSMVAPLSMYRCEVEFYQTMRPEFTIETPQVYGCELDTETGHFVLVMEDLQARDAFMGVATTPYTPDQAAAVIGTMADLHANYWNTPRVNDDFAWLETHLSGGNVDYFRRNGPEQFWKEYGTCPYKARIIDPTDPEWAPARLWSALWKVQEIDAAEVPTVLHGDTHVGNTYVTPAGEGGLLDWQLMRFGCWAHDVTYHIVSALTVEDRRAHEADLLRGYLNAMTGRGIAMPDWDRAWLLHRQNVVWGTCMWLRTPTALYDEERLSILLERSRAAMEDLETMAAIAGS